MKAGAGLQNVEGRKKKERDGVEHNKRGACGWSPELAKLANAEKEEERFPETNVKSAYWRGISICFTIPQWVSKILTIRNRDFRGGIAEGRDITEKSGGGKRGDRTKNF